MSNANPLSSAHFGYLQHVTLAELKRAVDEDAVDTVLHVLATRRRARSVACFENRVGGADLNPYPALSAIIASGLHGVEAGLELEPVCEGSAYADRSRARVPHTLRDAREVFASSAVARGAFGQELVESSLNPADVELASFQVAVTDWERARGFEWL
jgi:glutamine synthetase